MGKVERELESRGGPLAAPPPLPRPQGTPVKRGREKQGRWDGIGVSTMECPRGTGQVQKTGRADHRESHPLALLSCPSRYGARRRSPPLPRGAYRMEENGHLRI